MSVVQYLKERLNQNKLSEDVMDWLESWVSPMNKDELIKIRNTKPSDHIINSLKVYKPKEKVLLYRGLSPDTKNNLLISYSHNKKTAEGWADETVEKYIDPNLILVDLSLLPQDIVNIMSDRTGGMMEDAVNAMEEVVVWNN